MTELGGLGPSPEETVVVEPGNWGFRDESDGQQGPGCTAPGASFDVHSSVRVITTVTLAGGPPHKPALALQQAKCEGMSQDHDWMSR